MALVELNRPTMAITSPKALDVQAELAQGGRAVSWYAERAAIRSRDGQCDDLPRRGVEFRALADRLRVHQRLQPNPHQLQVVRVRGQDWPKVGYGFEVFRPLDVAEDGGDFSLCVLLGHRGDRGDASGRQGRLLRWT